jgi:hypothetical protein
MARAWGSIYMHGKVWVVIYIYGYHLLMKVASIAPPSYFKLSVLHIASSTDFMVLLLR